MTANQVTIAAVLLSLGYGAWLWADGAHLLLIGLPIVLLVRMSLNAIDGMMAREGGQESRLGFFLNEVGDVSKPGLMGWMARVILNIIPIDRSGGGAEMAIAPVRAALDSDDIVVLFPEGTRGAPEVMAPFRRGTSVLAAEYPDVPFVPVYLHGLGKTLPRGEWRFVPFASEAHIGLPRTEASGHGEPMAARLQAEIEAFAEQTSLARFVDD